MLFAGLVVHEHALLHGCGGQRAVDVFGARLSWLQGQLRGDLESVVCVAAVAAGVAGNQLQGVLVGGQLQCAQPALAVR